MPNEVEQGSSETPNEQPERLRGTVAWFSPERGYGFLTVRGWKDDLFFHNTDIIMDGYRTLDKGQLVEFQVSKRDGKMLAKKVVVIEDDDKAA